MVYSKAEGPTQGREVVAYALEEVGLDLARKIWEVKSVAKKKTGGKGKGKASSSIGSTGKHARSDSDLGSDGEEYGGSIGGEVGWTRLLLLTKRLRSTGGSSEAGPAPKVPEFEVIVPACRSSGEVGERSISLNVGRKLKDDKAKALDLVLGAKSA
jgi:hypothetical protein